MALMAATTEATKLNISDDQGYKITEQWDNEKEIKAAQEEVQTNKIKDAEAAKTRLADLEQKQMAMQQEEQH